jgi:hypothetical protein
MERHGLVGLFFSEAFMDWRFTRRAFLADVGRGMLVAAVGSHMAADLGLAAPDNGAEPRLNFGDLEPLVSLMQETPIARFLPTMVNKINEGTELKTLVAAAALANARTFGGEDYIGFHTLMALPPAYRMSLEMSGPQRALPVLKVLYRNTNRIHETGGKEKEVLHPVEPTKLSSDKPAAEHLRDAVHRKDIHAAEGAFAAIAQSGADEAFNQLLLTVQETTEVHRVVLPYRAWDLLDIVGRDQAHTLLRQSVRYCVQAERPGMPAHWYEPRTLLPNLLEQHKLLGKTPGTRTADDAWIEHLSKAIFEGTPQQAADAAAAALAEGYSPDCVGEAISLAANQLVLRDPGRPVVWESAGKPSGSVHGDSIGVHACDSANAWRNMARASNARNTFACLILGAYQASLDGSHRPELKTMAPIPPEYLAKRVTETDPANLLRDTEAAIRDNLQGRVTAVVQRYGSLGHPPGPVLDLMRKYATSEDGALHAEKYYRTASEEFTATRPAFRWRQLIALARVTASEYGRPAPGYAEAKKLLAV